MRGARLRGRTFASLRHRNFRLYYASHAVGFAGRWMQQIAAYWLVLTLTGSAVAVGALAFVQLLPVTLFGLAAGSVIDRFDLRRTIVVCESLMAVLAGLLAALTLSGVVTVEMVYVVIGVQGLAAVVGNPARHALVYRIVGPEDLTNAVALSSGLGTMARVAGPALGGLVVAVAGTGVAFAVNAVSYVAIIAAVLAMRVSELVSTGAAQSRIGILSGTRDALAFAFGSRRVTVAFFAVLVVSTASFNFDVLFPLLAATTLGAGAATFGLIAAIFGAGALCGALILATIGKARLRLVLLGAGGFGALELALAPQGSLAVVCALLVPLGTFYVLWGSSALASLQLAAPPHLRGRAVSLYFFAFQGGAPLGGLLAGWLTTVGGTRLAFTVAGTVAVTAAIVGALTLRGSRSPRAQPSEVPSSATTSAAASTARSISSPPTSR
ncbi:MAG TPA: MFS transporter [Gaiellaceae bacterium]|nr:MFS transporter [Gaiellaceae bacterium]